MTGALPNPWLPTPCRVRRVSRETPDTFTLEIEAVRTETTFLPGQFNMLYVFGVGEVPVSMSGDPASPGVVVHTVKSVGPVTTALCGLREGSVVGARGPYGRPWPMAETKHGDLLLVAGGLGLAPLRPVVHHVLRHRRDYGAVTILVGARTPDDLLYRSELERWHERDDVELLVTVDNARAGWKGHVGVAPALLPRVNVDATRTTALVCGPEVMMRFTVRELGRLGVADDRLYVSMERNMKCAVGFCGRCQYGPSFICKDGPVVRFDRIRNLFWVKEA